MNLWRLSYDHVVLPCALLSVVAHLRQSNRALQKRWFNSSEIDLFIWFRQSVPIRFQLAFNKAKVEQMICWDIYQGFHYYAVDTGEDRPNHYKQTPVLVNITCIQNLPNITRQFLAASENMDVGISDFILARLMECPGFHAIKDAKHINQHLS